MTKVLVCQHVPYEILGTLNPLFKKEGFRIQYVNFGRFPDLKPSLAGADGLIILGGPMHVGESTQFPHLLQEIKMIEEAIQKDIPVLGICLGAQLIAKTLGAEVQINQEREIGWHALELKEEAKKDPLFKHFKNKQPIFQWHRDTFDIPKGAVQLAQSSLCKNQAFRYQEKVYAFQFHLEVDKNLIERWLQVSDHQEILESVKEKMSVEKIRRETEENISTSIDLSKKVFSEFIKLFGFSKKFQRLQSR